MRAEQTVTIAIRPARWALFAVTGLIVGTLLSLWLSAPSFASVAGTAAEEAALQAQMQQMESAPAAAAKPATPPATTVPAAQTPAATDPAADADDGEVAAADDTAQVTTNPNEEGEVFGLFGLPYYGWIALAVAIGLLIWRFVVVYRNRPPTE